MSSRLNEIERILRRGVHSLSDSLFQEWPARENDRNEIAEGNLIIHIGHAFLAAEYCAYSEYPILEKERVDLVAFHPNRPEYIVLEAKRFLKTDESGLVPDLQRLARWPHKPAVAGVVCMTRDNEIKNWWINPQKSEQPGARRSDAWGMLRKCLLQPEAIRGHMALPHNGDMMPSGDSFTHEVLYALFHIR